MASIAEQTGVVQHTIPTLLSSGTQAHQDKLKRRDARETPADAINQTPRSTPAINATDVDSVRQKLVVENETAVASLCYAALEHACDGITHMDQKILGGFSKLFSISKADCESFRLQIAELKADVKDWISHNFLKAALMVVGLGGTAFKAAWISQLMKDNAQNFIDWGQSTSVHLRFLGFVALMTVRLVVSTLVPPTSPAFGIILQAATPESQKWTAMPLFLAASTVAGAAPWLLDKLLQACFRKDFIFTIHIAKRFVDIWPLTCWTGPTMNKVFQASGGGKTGACLAVIVAHAAPFMGAQTTMIQRYFLPHPLDTIISQPFGMSEDLISMAMAEAMSNPMLGSGSLTLLLSLFNFAQFFVFTSQTDVKALVSGILNIAVGLFFLFSCRIEGMAMAMILLQLSTQMFAVPVLVQMLPFCKMGSGGDRTRSLDEPLLTA